MTTPGPLPNDQGGLGYVAGLDATKADPEFITVPAGERWKVWGLAFDFVTDASPINRVPAFSITDGTNTIVHITTTTFQGANLTRRWNWNLGWTLGSGGISTRRSVPGPWPLLLPAGSVIEAGTPLLSSFDEYLNVLILRERWREPT